MTKDRKTTLAEMSLDELKEELKRIRKLKAIAYARYEKAERDETKVLRAWGRRWNLDLVTAEGEADADR